jgi:hypothetical protein
MQPMRQSTACIKSDVLQCKVLAVRSVDQWLSALSVLSTSGWSDRANFVRLNNFNIKPHMNLNIFPYQYQES